MLSVAYARRGQTPEDLRRLAMSAPQLRTRERFLALYEIMQESSGAALGAEATGRPGARAVRPNLLHSWATG